MNVFDALTLREALDLLSRLWALPLLMVLERSFPTRPIGLFGRGWLSDAFYYLDPWFRPAVFGWVIIRANALLGPEGLVSGFGALPGPMQFLLLLLATELVFYVMHRLMHQLPWLWEFHRVHHSSTQYYALMTKRLHLFDELLFGIPTLCTTLALRPDPNVVFALVFFRRFMDLYGHSNINGPKMTGYFLVTPHFHAWHHSAEPEAFNKNFSRDTVLFDYLFGTAFYPKDRVASVFGEPGYTHNYLRQQIQPFIELARRCRKKRENTLSRPQKASSLD